MFAEVADNGARAVFSFEATMRRLSFLVTRDLEMFHPLIHEPLDAFSLDVPPYISWPGEIFDTSAMIEAGLPGRSRIDLARSAPAIVLVTLKSLESQRVEDLILEAVHRILFCLEAEGDFQAGMDDWDFVSHWSGRTPRGAAYTRIPIVYFVTAEFYHRNNISHFTALSCRR